MNPSLVDELKDVFGFEKALIKSRQVDDKEFITIVFEEKVSKGFGMISLGGYIMSEIIPMIEGTHRLNSISTTYHRGSLETKILIVEGEW